MGGDDCFGTPVVEARPAGDAAREGQILASEVVRLLAARVAAIASNRPATLQLKGLGEIVAYEVAWDAGPAVSAPLPPALSTSGRCTPRPVDEREALTTAWKRALEARPRLRSSPESRASARRVAAELAGESMARARSCWSADVTGARRPLQPLAGRLHLCRRLRRRRAARPARRVRRDLARLVPSLASRFVSLPEPMRADPEIGVTGVRSGHRAPVAIAADAPVLLVVDDLHWAARPTLLLLRHVVRKRAVERLMVVLRTTAIRSRARAPAVRSPGRPSA